MTTAAVPAAAGPIVPLEGRNGRFTGYSLTFTAAGRVRFWSGPGAGATVPSGSGSDEDALLDEVDAAAAGSFNFSLANPMDGAQYINGVYMEAVSGAVPEGFIRFRGPHS